MWAGQHAFVAEGGAGEVGGYLPVIEVDGETTEEGEDFWEDSLGNSILFYFFGGDFGLLLLGLFPGNVIFDRSQVGA